MIRPWHAVVTRMSGAGERYITRTRQEYLRLMISAGGGGAVMAFTVVLKFYIVWLKLPLGLTTLYCCLNYSATFLLMQALGFTLATKQPSMMAATLVKYHGRAEGCRESARKFVVLFSRITRSLFAAGLGNFAMVISACLAIHFVYLAVHGMPVLGMKSAHHVLLTSQLTCVPTFANAALTGVFLWLANTISGWIEEISDSHLFGSISANVIIGCLLGLAPALGVLLHLPIEAKHFTLVTGALVYSLGAYAHGPGIPWSAAFSALAGVLLVGLLNFWVSFLVSFCLALGSWGIAPRWALGLFRGVSHRIRRSPREFVLPPVVCTESLT